MGATSPLWLTVLLAVLTPVLTLAGVLWTQRAADRRAHDDARLRLQHERQLRSDEQRLQVYKNAHATQHRLLWSVYKTDHKIAPEIDGLALEALTDLMLIGPTHVYEATRLANKAVRSYVSAREEHGEESPEFAAAGEAVRRLYPEMLTAMNRELGSLVLESTLGADAGKRGGPAGRARAGGGGREPSGSTAPPEAAP